MVDILISCGTFKDLNFKVEGSVELTPDALGHIRNQAGFVIDECERRQVVGGECTGNCPIPGIYTAKPEILKTAIEQARSGEPFLPKLSS